MILKSAAIYGVTILAAMLCFPADAAPEVNVRTKYYKVRGNTAADIRRDLDRRSPVEYDARLNWNIQWRFTHRQFLELCKITKISVKVDIMYILPKLSTRRLPASVKHAWQKYMKALIFHEKGHANTGINVAYAIERKIKNMARPTCKQLTKDANAVAYREIWRGNAIDKKYDKDTNHGATEGAVFP